MAEYQRFVLLLLWSFPTVDMILQFIIVLDVLCVLGDLFTSEREYSTLKENERVALLK